jgi:pyruvate formate-lyase/glycerol dehydratase family glycyl radical enzyme
MDRHVTLKDLTLADQKRSPRVEALRAAYFRAVPEICTERPRLVTRISLEKKHFDKPVISSLDKARLYRYVLENRKPIVHQDHGVDRTMTAFPVQARSLFAGSTTSHFKGVPIFPEFMGLALWPELLNIKRRAANPTFLTDEDVRVLNEEVFPHWLDHSVIERCRTRMNKGRTGAPVGGKDAPEMVLLERLVFFLASKGNCISHTIPDFSQVMRVGLRGLVEQAHERGRRTQDRDEREFYAAMVEAMEGIATFSRNLAAEARRLASISHDARERDELLALADANQRVPEFPARSFREGLTAVWICWTAIHLENPDVGLSLGRLDQLLFDLYRRDIETGALTVPQAIELLCCLWLKIGDHVPSVPATGEQLFGGTGSNQAITIGGVDSQGQDAVNDLSYLMIRVTELMMLRDPNLNARYFSGVNPPEYLRRLCEANLDTGATPALHNDRAVIAALVSKGDSLEQARDYGVTGCVEPGSNGRFYGASASILLNLTSVLELALYNGKHRHTGEVLISEPTGDAASFTSFEDFEKAFLTQVSWMIDRAVTLNEELGRTHQEMVPTPILSSLFEGPMEKGKDLIFGGATLNSSGASIIGFADVVDSLAAIEQVVFVEKAVSLPALLQAMDKNFEGHEALMVRLRNPARTPKYGNENPAADRIARWLASNLNEIFGRKINYRGGHYRVGYWTMTNHAGFGRLMRATPNGRRDHENFTSGLTPVSGVTPSLTKALRSVASLPPELLGNGVAVNLKYTPDQVNRQGMLDNFVASVEGYFDPVTGGGTGGMEIQFNVTTHDTFVDAVKNPQAHSELLVRVSGYTAYFKDLNPQMQQEIIERTEYNLTTGQAVEFGKASLS